MGAPNNEFAFDLAAARQAAENWQRRSAERGKKLKAYKDGRYDAVEPKARLALRVNRLLGKVRTAVPEDRRGLSAGAEDAGRSAARERVGRSRTTSSNA